jgi:anaerobic selenocysteine-containing dehydrogenase
MIERLMLNSPPHSMMHPDPWHSDVLIIIGTNPLHSNRGYKTAENLRQFKKEGKTLYVIDPRVSETARKADTLVAHKPGSDIFLLSAMAADYVLATPGGYEKWEWSTLGRKFPKLTVHLRPPVVESTGDVKTEAEIFNTLLGKTGGPSKASAWFKALAKKGWENNWIFATMIVGSMIAARGNPVQAFISR